MESSWSIAADWVSAIATTAAVVVALLISHRDASRRDEERRDDEKRQARLVTMKVAGASRDRIKLRVTNYSDAPIIGLELDGAASEHEPTAKWKSRTSLLTDGRVGVDVVPPGDSWEVIGGFTSQGGSVQLPPLTSIVVDISFRDHNGRIWRKRTNQQPERIFES